MAAREPYNVTATTNSGVASSIHSSPLRSPVPYLFGALAAMLGLIAFALLILACSYWKLSGYHENEDGGSEEAERDLECGEGQGDDTQAVKEQKVLVIMAGEVKPTFLAIPISSSRSSSFGENRYCTEKGEKLEVDQGEKQVRLGVDGVTEDHRESTGTQQSSRQDH